ncbi:MAG: FhaA domain-containing protein [Acidimicrobiales bacterium]
MGLEQFERRLERLVEGTFAKVYRRGLQPVELGRRLAREMDLQRAVGVHGMLAPNDFTVVLAPPDAERYAPLVDSLGRELAEAAREHAHDEGYGFLGPVAVAFVQDTALQPGVFLVEAEMKEGPGGGPPASLVLPDGQRVSLGEGPITIGRLPSCQVVLDDPNVSRRHAELRRDGERVMLVDLGSTNGTVVNGLPVGSRRLADGDRITLGRTTLAFEAS